jgi:nucleoside-diphosphate-sugar epimerase
MFVRLLTGRPILIPGDGTSIAQVGYVEDQARALRMLMAKPASFGRRYNLTGADYFTAEGYVDTFAQVTGAPAEKVFIPAALMDDLFDGRVSARAVAVKANVDTRGSERPDEIQRNRFLLSMLVQRIAPHLHRWNDNVVFGVERLRQDVGWEPEVRFAAAVAQTFDWFQAARIAETQTFDFSYEDDLLRLVKELEADQQTRDGSESPARWPAIIRPP